MAHSVQKLGEGLGEKVKYVGFVWDENPVASYICKHLLYISRAFLTRVRRVQWVFLLSCPAPADGSSCSLEPNSSVPLEEVSNDLAKLRTSEL
jgi:hypothetical protein